MKNMIIVTSLSFVFGLIFLGAMVYLFVLITKALKRYIKSGEVRKEKSNIKRSLGETLKEHRTRCKMTQEFVAESIGVSRQAVSKWESGVSDPSTSNLFALAKLFGVSVEELLNEVE
ncbi:MAG: helix-turn-helix transcriptional regulator [Oscillospiraceae bacterium]|nr:helix-turn-helix transcriptional regulator [Oscillospiraceae bacterium]